MLHFGKTTICPWLEYRSGYHASLFSMKSQCRGGKKYDVLKAKTEASTRAEVVWSGGALKFKGWGRAYRGPGGIGED